MNVRNQITSKVSVQNSNSRTKEQRIKDTWDNSSESELEEDQDEVANLCFMPFEDDIEVPSSSNSSFNFDNDYCHDIDNDDDDEIFLVSKLMSKCKSLLSKKNHYKHELTSLTKEFENLKNEFSSLIVSNSKLADELKNLNSLEEQLKKVNDENYKLSKEMLELRNTISKFQKGKETLDNLFES